MNLLLSLATGQELVLGEYFLILDPPGIRLYLLDVCIQQIGDVSFNLYVVLDPSRTAAVMNDPGLDHVLFENRQQHANMPVKM